MQIPLSRFQQHLSGLTPLTISRFQSKEYNSLNLTLPGNSWKKRVKQDNRSFFIESQFSRLNVTLSYENLVKTEDENNYVIFSKSETSDPKSYSSLKLDTATMTESSKKKEKSDNNENETVPIKASIIMSSAPNTLVSVLSVMLPLLSCLMLQKF